MALGGARAHVKQALWVEQVRPNSVQLHNVANVVNCLTCYFGLQNLAHDGARRNVKCYFYEVKPTNVNKVDQFNSWTVEGT
jgi:hypothetical protein